MGGGEGVGGGEGGVGVGCPLDFHKSITKFSFQDDSSELEFETSQMRTDSVNLSS